MTGLRNRGEGMWDSSCTRGYYGSRCGGSRYDTRQQQWRHLDTCQYRTILEAGVPRVECEEHKVK